MQVQKLLTTLNLSSNMSSDDANTSKSELQQQYYLITVGSSGKLVVGETKQLKVTWRKWDNACSEREGQNSSCLVEKHQSKNSSTIRSLLKQPL